MTIASKFNFKIRRIQVFLKHVIYHLRKERNNHDELVFRLTFHITSVRQGSSRPRVISGNGRWVMWINIVARRRGSNGIARVNRLHDLDVVTNPKKFRCIFIRDSSLSVPTLVQHHILHTSTRKCVPLNNIVLIPAPLGLIVYGLRVFRFFKPFFVLQSSSYLRHHAQLCYTQTHTHARYYLIPLMFRVALDNGTICPPIALYFVY